MSLNLALAAVMLLAGLALAWAQPENFVYDEHGKRDPFAPLVGPGGAMISYDSEMTVADLNLQGILADAQGQNLAIINGKVVKVADLIGGYEVGEIGADEVDLVKGQQHFLIKLKKGGM